MEEVRERERLCVKRGQRRSEARECQRKNDRDSKRERGG